MVEAHYNDDHKVNIFGSQAPAIGIGGDLIECLIFFASSLTLDARKQARFCQIFDVLGFAYKNAGKSDAHSQFAEFHSRVKMFWLLILAFAYLAYKWSVSNYDYFERIGLPFEKPLPLFGNMIGLITQRESLVYTLQRNYRRFKSSK